MTPLRRLTGWIAGCVMTIGAVSGVPSDPARLFAPENLLAWCIVPYDARERGPEERVAMLQRLGLTQYAWDWRDRHLPVLAEELRAAQERGVKVRAVWLWIDATADQPGALGPANRAVIDTVRAADVAVDYWLGFHDNVFADRNEAERVQRGAAFVRTVLEAAGTGGSTVSLYNHGGWFGESEHQLEILRAVADPRLGIVYNFHHAHHEIDEWPENLARLLPHLRAVNLNGMRPAGPKILPIGAGTHEAEMLRVLVQSGYTGPIGILGHVEDADAEVVLQANLAGLRRILGEWPEASASTP